MFYDLLNDLLHYPNFVNSTSSRAKPRCCSKRRGSFTFLTQIDNGQMLSPPRRLTSTIGSVTEIAPVSLETGPPRATWRLKGQRYNPLGAWPESSRGTDYGSALGLDTKTYMEPSAA